MAYCTEEQVRESLGGITINEISSAHVLEIIEEATSRIDSFIGIKYALPLNIPVPSIIQRICRDISACHAYNDVIARGIAVSDKHKIISRCERAEETLEALRDGKQRLIYDTGEVADENTGAASSPWSSTMNYGPSIDIDDPTEWDWTELEKESVRTRREDD